VARKQRERQKAPSKVSSSARNTKTRLILPSRLSERSFAARDRAMHVLGDMRHGASLSRAARDHGVSVRTIRRYVGGALLQERAGGRIRATKSDRFVRYLQLPGRLGPIEQRVRGSRQASEAARYKAALNRRLRGDRGALAPWHGKKIAGIELITDAATLKSLAERDLLPYSLYRSLSGGGA
jgi:hypothetical protein